MEDVLPRLAAVVGAEDAALLVRAPQVTHRRNVHDVRVARMDEDAPDVLRGVEAHVAPGVPGVGGLVDAVAPAGRLPVLRLPGADPDQVWVGLVEGDVADGAGRLVVEERRPRGAVVLGLPDASGPGRDVEDLRLRLDDGEVGDAPAHERGADLAVLQVRDGGLEGGLGGCRGRIQRDGRYQRGGRGAEEVEAAMGHDGSRCLGDLSVSGKFMAVRPPCSTASPPLSARPTRSSRRTRPDRPGRMRPAAMWFRQDSCPGSGRLE